MDYADVWCVGRSCCCLCWLSVMGAVVKSRGGGAMSARVSQVAGALIIRDCFNYSQGY